MAQYIFKKISLFSPTFVEPLFMRVIRYIPTDHFVLQCFDTVGWTMEPVKIVSKITYWWQIKPYPLT